MNFFTDWYYMNDIIIIKIQAFFTGFCVQTETC